jgi:RNA polymerase sigma factor (sigma-70 family)
MESGIPTRRLRSPAGDRPGLRLASEPDREAYSSPVLLTPAWQERETLDRDSLFASFQPLVQRLIRQYGEDSELRQDLEGEIYCRFCALLEQYDPGRGIPLRPYLVRMLSAAVYTFTRSQWRRQQRETSLDATYGLNENLLPSSDPSRHWDHELMTQELLRSIPDAISQLPLRQRQVIIWRYYESRSFEEISERLHIRPATARSLLRHGLNSLRRRIGMWSGEQDL